jgi:hypothetical protein
MGEQAIFQAQARAVDLALTDALDQLEAQNLPPETVASGALYAIVRYHLNKLNVVRNETVLQGVMLKAISATVKGVIEAEKAAAAPRPN